MRPTILSILFCILFIVYNGCETSTKSTKLETNMDSVSYIIGTDMAQSLDNIKSDLNVNALINGLEDQLEGKTLKVEKDEARRVMREFTGKMQQKLEDERKVNAASNTEEGAKFLEENKNKEGVITTESGLQYIALKKGDGPKPITTDQVRVHYRGTTLEGKEFDSSYKRGEPATFGVTSVIKGWTEALQLMNVGSKFKLFVPPDLAYGERGAGGMIGPNAVLIFEVELLGIEK